MAIYEIPLTPQPQTMTIALGGATYNLRFYYENVLEGGWMLDIADSINNPFVCGIPLVTGVDLLAQYVYLGIAGQLYATTDGSPSVPPTFYNLGVIGHVYFEPIA